jgi:O-antigen/teichoic acid export membrane protein
MSSISKQTFWVVLGTFSINFFSLIISMILSRYMDKVEYGTYRQMLFIYTNLSLIFSAGLPSAYLFFIPRINQDELKNLLFLFFKILTFSAIIVAVLFFFGNSLIAKIFNNMELAQPLKIFSIVPILLIPTIGIENIFIALKKSHFASLFNFSSKLLLTTIICVLLFLLGNSIDIIIFAWIISAFLTYIIAFFLKKNVLENINSKKLSIAPLEILKYGMPLMLSSIVQFGITFSDNYFISQLGTDVFADFSNGFMQLPIAGIIMSSLSAVLIAEYSSIFKNGNNIIDFQSVWILATKKAVLLLFPVIFFFMTFSHETIALLYGEKYYNAGIYFRLMMVVNFFNITTVVAALLALGKTRFSLNLNLFILFIIWPVEYLVFKSTNNPTLIAATSVLFNILKTVISLSYLTTLVGLSIKEILPFKYIGIISLISIFAALLSAQIFDYTHIYFPNLLLNFTITGFIYATIFLIISTYLKMDIFLVIKSILQRK